MLENRWLGEKSLPRSLGLRKSSWNAVNGRLEYTRAHQGDCKLALR